MFKFLSLFLIFCHCNSITSPKKESRELSPVTKVCLLIERSLQETVEFVPANMINDIFFRQYGVPSDLQEHFIKMYEQLRTDQSLVLEKFSKRESVRYFLLNRCQLLAEESMAATKQLSKLATSSNPVYMSFALHAEQMPDFNSIGNPYYIKTLARSFGVSERDIVEGIWILLRNDPVYIYEAVALMIDVNVKSPRFIQADFLFRNVVVPFLTYISKGIPLDASLETGIFRSFKESFEPNGDGNSLREFTLAFKRYLGGSSLHVKYINALNTVIGTHNFRLYVDDRTTIGYHMLNYRIPINRDSIGNVIFLKKISICLSMPFLGLSTSKERDVIITIDDVAEYADDILFALENGKPFVSFTSVAEGSWNGLSTGFTPDAADRICVKLMQQEFKNQSKEQITQQLVREIALHEVKHKWDETTHADKGWYVVDCEMSAHLTEVIFGATPRYSLVSLLHRMHGFYAKTSMDSVRAKLQPLLQQLWKYMRDVSESTMTIDTLRLKMAVLYNSYGAIEAGPLPPLELFNREIVTPVFNNLPEFSSIELEYMVQ